MGGVIFKKSPEESFVKIMADIIGTSQTPNFGVCEPYRTYVVKSLDNNTKYSLGIDIYICKRNLCKNKYTYFYKIL